MDTLAQQYIRLAHAIEAHAPGTIDGYYGPAELADTTPRPLETLADEADRLLDAIAQDADASRRAWLDVQARAMQTSIALLRGQTLPYAEEVCRLYDIAMPRTDEADFDAAIATLDALLPGEGPIPARDLAFRQRFELEPERLPALIEIMVAELRDRTRARYDLPDGEHFDVRLVTDQPWGAYNWYLGTYQSRVELNCDLPVRLTSLPDMLAHEGYPGHHSEQAIKEARLYHGQGRGEQSVLLINSPECVISEGIATRALRQVMGDEEVAAWLTDELLPISGLRVGGDEIRTMLAIAGAKACLSAVPGNAAQLLHADGADDETVIRYLMRYRLATREEAEKSLQFISHPLYRSYIFTYTVGGQLLDQLAGVGFSAEGFARLLHDAVTPGMVRAWVATGVRTDEGMMG